MNSYHIDTIMKLVEEYKRTGTLLDGHIGKKVKYKEPRCEVHYETFQIRHIQVLYDGSLGYNLICITGEYATSLVNRVGRAASIDSVYFI